jgi:leucyl/phenylalanyl-tRNA--protein transferase
MVRLGDEYVFPSPRSADKHGIVAYGGDLDPERIIEAYKNGIFPWFESDQNLLWWSPDPRMILYPSKIKVSKSLKSFIKKSPFKITFNSDFEEVINSCSNIKRLGQKGTWITDGLKDSFLKLHEMGLAMSVEVWENSEIVGGLYGLDLGDVFCGESMFSKSSNSSKVALLALSSELKKNKYKFIDCQIPTEHLKSMGGEKISRNDFLKLLIK